MVHFLVLMLVLVIGLLYQKTCHLVMTLPIWMKMLLGVYLLLKHLIFEQIGANINYLKEELILSISFYKGNIIGITLPTFVELTVTDSPPGLKGDTAQGGTKLATLETGLTTQVPLFISNGEKIRVDTRTGDYIERAG